MQSMVGSAGVSVYESVRPFFCRFLARGPCAAFGVTWRLANGLRSPSAPQLRPINHHLPTFHDPFHFVNYRADILCRIAFYGDQVREVARR